MDLKSGYPFWAVKNGLLHAFPQLRGTQSCEVAVVGGGITGALIARELEAHGHDVVLVEQRDIGWGSTAASTALLQYEIDTSMTELANRYGEKDAVAAYRGCARAIGTLQRIAAGVRDVGFAPMPSIYFASRARDVPGLRAELALRRKHGFDAQWLSAADLRKRHGLHAPGAILTPLAAGVDPYRLTWRLLARLEARGTRIFDRTRVQGVRVGPRGVELRSDHGMLRARHVAVAAGYAAQRWLKQRVAVNRSSYAFITDPLRDADWHGMRGMMAWETARPYLYLRGTSEGRLLVGGADDAVDLPSRRDARVQPKARKLVAKLGRVLPQLDVKPAFSWAGTFAETADGLPFFGTHAEYGPRVQFAMAYGGNGITYSAIGAAIIRAAIEGRRHPLAQLFSFSRLER